MLIPRKAFRTHLAHLHCEGLIPDIALQGQFVGIGATSERDFLVISGKLDKADPLPSEVGITALKMMLQVLDAIDEDDVSLTVEERAIVIGAHDRNFRLVTASPKVIGTRIDPEMQERLLNLIPAGNEWISLEHRFVDGALKAASILRAEEMVLTVGPSGSTLRVGDERLNTAAFDLPAMKSAVEYNLTLNAATMVAVFKQLGDFTKAQITMTGPDGIIGVREGEYKYLISPNRPKDAK